MSLFPNSQAISNILNSFVIRIFIDKGRTFRINGKKYQASAGDILILSPNMILEYDDMSDKSGIYEIKTSIDVVMELPSPFDTDVVAASRRMPLLSPTQEELNVILDLYSLIEDVKSQQQGIYADEILKSLIFAVIYKIGEVYDRLKAVMPDHVMLNDERLSDEFFRLLASHYRNHRTVKFYAAEMALTPKYLSKAIKDITGKTVHEWVDDAIILEIKNMLRTTDKTVLQISEELNFCTPSAFVQFFKQHVGTTPFKYRHSDEW